LSAASDLANAQHQKRRQEHHQHQHSQQQPIDYDGISLISELKRLSHYPLPAILITATTDENVKIRAQQAQIGYLRKIIKPIALRALMSSLLSKNLENNYTNYK